MKNRKLRVLNAFSAFCAIFTLAISLSPADATAASENTYANIHTGDFQVTGATALGYSHTSYNGGGSLNDFAVQTTTAYFIHTGIGVGGTFLYNSSDTSTSWSIGPTAVWHILSLGQFTFPISGSVLLKHTDAGNQSQTNPDILVNGGAFFYPAHWVGFGPIVQFEQLIGTSYIGYQTSQFSIIASISIFL